MNNVKTVLKNIRAPKSLQSGVDGGYVLRQTIEVEDGAPVFSQNSAQISKVMTSHEKTQPTKIWG